jgi:hypothetical protein
MDKRALRSAAQAAVKQGEELLRDYESKLARKLPPYPVSAQYALRAHYFALMRALKDPELYSAILQDFLEHHNILVPRGVFKRDVCTEWRPPAMPFAIDGPPSTGVLLAPRRRGRPRKDSESWDAAMRWLELGEPSWGELAQDLNKGRKDLTPHERKKQADKLRQRAKYIVKPREKNPK